MRTPEFPQVLGRENLEKCSKQALLQQCVAGKNVFCHYSRQEKLKEGWSLSRLIMTDRTLLRLGLYEITSFEETPGRVAINEIIEIAKKYSDKTSAKFINGVLSQFVTDEA